MKKTKKLSAMFLASVITAGAVSSLSAGADEGSCDKDVIAEKIANSEYYIPLNETYYINNVYLTKSDKPGSFGTYDYIDIGFGRAVYCEPNKVNIKMNESDLDKAETIIKELLPEVEISKSEEANGLCSISIFGFSKQDKIPFEESYKKEIKFEQAVEIYKKLGEIADIHSFNYEKNPVFASCGQTYITDFLIHPTDDLEEIEQLEQYINNIDLKCHIEKTQFSIAVIPDEEISTADLAALSKQIQDDLGFNQFIWHYASGGNEKSTFIDLHNNIKGDANNDGTLALSDAIAILQTVGNPDTYGLTAQGEYNADIAGDFDGITNLDALTVQRKLLKLE